MAIINPGPNAIYIMVISLMSVVSIRMHYTDSGVIRCGGCSRKKVGMPWVRSMNIPLLSLPRAVQNPHKVAEVSRSESISKALTTLGSPFSSPPVPLRWIWSITVTKGISLSCAGNPRLPASRKPCPVKLCWPFDKLWKYASWRIPQDPLFRMSAYVPPTMMIHSAPTWTTLTVPPQSLVTTKRPLVTGHSSAILETRMDQHLGFMSVVIFQHSAVMERLWEGCWQVLSPRMRQERKMAAYSRR